MKKTKYLLRAAVSMLTVVMVLSVMPHTAEAANWDDSSGIRGVSVGINNISVIKGGSGDALIWSWGNNNYRQLGSMDFSGSSSAVPIKAGSVYGFMSVSAGQYHTAAIDYSDSRANRLWVWGSNEYGQLGNGGVGGVLGPYGTNYINMTNNWQAVSAGGNHTLALDDYGGLYAWGDNQYGQLGIVQQGGTKNTPTKLTHISGNWKSVSAGLFHTAAILRNGMEPNGGTLYAWGFNNKGQLGNNSNADSIGPVKIGSYTDWEMVSTGSFHTVGLRGTSGNMTLWAWGNNTAGELGIGNNTNKSSPQQVGTDKNWKSVSAGGSHTVAVKTDGTLWAWGYNGRGQLGDGTIVEKNVPVQVGTAADWSNVWAGGNRTVALKQDGTLWGWGDNQGGLLMGYETSEMDVLTPKMIWPQPNVSAAVTVTAPVLGATPIRSADSSGNFTVTDVSWIPDGEMPNSHSTFKPDTKYKVNITLTANNLPGSSNLYHKFEDDFTVTVNGKAASVSIGHSGGIDNIRAYLTYEFPATANITNITVTPAAPAVQKGATQRFSATVTGTNGPPQAVAWSIVGAVNAGTTIDATGLLTVAANETAESFTVKATSTADGTKSGTTTVTPANKPTVVSVSPSGTDVETSGDIIITFSEAMDTATAGIVQLNNLPVLTGGSWSEDKTKFTIPYSSLAYSTKYTVGIWSFKSLKGLLMSSNGSNSFTTASSAKTNVSFTAQANGASSATTSTAIQLTFSQNVTGLTDDKITIANDTGTAVKGALSGSGKDYSIALSSVTTQGNVKVSVADFGTYKVTTSELPVAIYKAPAATAPLAPTNFAATAGDAQAALSWTTPGNGGSAITKYQYSYGATVGYSANWNDIPDSGGNTWSYTVTGLTNGTNYTFEVRAVNEIGNGVSSGTKTATPVSASTGKLLQSITSPSNITNLANGTAKTDSALGLPETVSMVTDDGNVTASVTWDVDGSSYNPADTGAQTFTVNGTAQLPSGVVNTNGVSLAVTVSVSVNAASISTDNVLLSIVAPPAITGLPSGTAKTAAALGLPSTVTMVTDDGNVTANVTWDVDGSLYDPAATYEQTFTVNGEAALPSDVVNANSVSLYVSISVTVNEATETDKVLVSITAPNAITNLSNGTSKTAAALGLPATVTMVTDNGSVAANVTWDVEGSSYNPSGTAAQTFTVNGTAQLPNGVVNTNGVSLEVAVSVSVNAALLPNDKVLISITAPSAITNLANGTAKTAAALGLPAIVTMVTDNGSVAANVTWNVTGSSYSPANTSAQTFTVNGTAQLPNGVVNTNSVSLAVTVSVSVNAASLPNDKVLISITTPPAITNRVNGSAKTAEALGLPDTVTMVTDNGSVAANVTWDVSGSSYNPANTAAQTFTVSGTAQLPTGVVNTNNVPLTLIISVTVNAASVTPPPGSDFITIRDIGVGGLGRRYEIVIKDFDSLNLPNDATILVAVSRNGSRQNIVSYRASQISEVSCTGTATKIEVWLADGMINLTNTSQGIGATIYGFQSWPNPVVP